MKLRIKEIIKEKGLTQQQLAEQLNMSRGGLAQIIDGNPTKESLEKIAAALGVEPYELWIRPGAGMECPHCGGRVFIEIKKADD